MSLRADIIGIINSALPTIPVVDTQTEAYDQSLISVQYESAGSKKQATVYFDSNVVISVIVKIVSPDSYAAELDTQVDFVKNAILRNPLSFLRGNIANFSIKYSYGRAGDNNIGLAVLSFTVNCQESFEPIVTTELSRINVGIDFISPVSRKELFLLTPEKYLKEPDGVIDFELPHLPDQI